MALPVQGQSPSGFHKWTTITSPLRRGKSSNTASTGVFDRIPPSQYSAPSIRTAGNAGGSAPDAMTWRASNAISRLSK